MPSVLEHPAVPAIGQCVVWTAQTIWESAGKMHDFCIQDADSGGDWIIFGSTNRVRYHVRTGWTIFPSSCTDEFIGSYQDWCNAFNVRYQEG